MSLLDERPAEIGPAVLPVLILPHCLSDLAPRIHFFLKFPGAVQTVVRREAFVKVRCEYEKRTFGLTPSENFDRQTSRLARMLTAGGRERISERRAKSQFVCDFLTM
jgi:hypothetical protein